MFPPAFPTVPASPGRHTKLSPTASSIASVGQVWTRANFQFVTAGARTQIAFRGSRTHRGYFWLTWPGRAGMT